MKKRQIPLLFAVVIAALVAGGTLGAADIPNDEASVRHALNRLTYGPRPGDVERVRETGLARWIEQQLNPARLSDSELATRLPRIPSQDTAFASPQEARRAARAAIDDLAQARLVRAVYSERQLEEVLVDFWFNHFNVFAGKGRTAIYLPEYERDAIRPHVLGRFRDLLGATAKHPAMLFYLDNWLSAAPQLVAAPSGRRRGLNENYARELLELHTLGVDGGYTQKDVVEVARAFTGWTIGPAGGQPRRSLRGIASQAEAGFRFARMLHDDGAKVVLGQAIGAGGGIADGERVLDIVATHPSTARHIATKLARRFVNDEPPEALVSRAAARFRETDGDLREVVRTIVTSPEFFATETRNAKVKTPLEFVVSAARVTADDMPNTRAMVRALRQLGMPLYMCQPPTGYDDTAETWITSGAIVTRINIAQQLAGRLAEVVAAPEFQRR
jgi:uncharacterized protein (DUF1800 family)